MGARSTLPERMAIVETKVDRVIVDVGRIEGKIDAIGDRVGVVDGFSRVMRGLVPFLALGLSIVALWRGISGG